MPRAAFRLRIKASAIEAYEHDHKNVWPELLARLKEVGISDYSIFRRGQELFLVMRVIDFEATWHALETDPVNLRWQEQMARHFEPVPDLQAGERLATMKELFYME
jgi:L-rhamnose mutarotase